jgi:hypothetical protein
MTAKMTTSKRVTALLGAIVTAVVLAAPVAASAAPVLDVTSTHIPPGPVPVGTYAKYEIVVSNTGDAETTSPVTANFTAPPGFKITTVEDGLGQVFPGFSAWNCLVAGDSQSVSCAGPEFFFSSLPISAGSEACVDTIGVSCQIIIQIKADPDAPIGPAAPTIEVCNPDAAPTCDTVDDPLAVVPYDFRVASFDGEVLKRDGDPATQAGSHPDTASTEFFLSSSLSGNDREYPIDDLKDAAVKLPPGLVGNPRVVPTCSQAQLTSADGRCPAESQVGTVTLLKNGEGGTPGSPGSFKVGVYNMEVPFGLPALFGFNIIGNATQVYGSVRSGSDYGVTVTSKNVPETFPIAGVSFTFWGVPADPSHDAERVGPGCPEGCASTAPTKPFISLPTSCVGPVETFLEVAGWLGGSAGSSFISHDNSEPTPNPIGNDGCNAVDFSPTLQARPTTNVADAPSGLEVDLHIPQNETCDPGPPVTCATAEAHLKDTTVTLPEGLVINPAGANGLDGCSPSELGLTTPLGTTPITTTPDPANCPSAAKLGTVEVETPLLEKALKGAVYIADPYDNPFQSLLALYITVNDPKTGIVVKLAGKVTPDPNTGRLSAVFEDNPQRPFEDFRLHFFGGSGGSLRTPAVCGAYSTTSSMTPWTAPDSGPPATPSDPWAITQGANGGACATSDGARPHSPFMDAGTVSPIAGSYSPFVVNLRREDGSQQFSSVTLTPPPGFTGKLAGIPSCPDAALAAAAAKSGQQEKAAPSCPAASELGSVTAGAGAGPAPYYAQGKAYLAGPYKGAPLSMAIVTPATAGPFDLGTIVVRVALSVNSTSGQITATADPIPSILQGIPLDVRSIQVKLDRSQFARNGTSCEPLAVTGQLTSTLGQVASLSNRFQLGECSSLPFKPKLAIRLLGGTKRGSHPALRAVLQMPEGGANISRVSAALPHSEFLDQSHIGTVCTRVQFAADQCPAASVYGHAVATSPLVDYAVEGPVYLRSSSNKLPDLVMALRGPAHQPIEVEAVARIDSVKGGIRSTFEGVPDLPLGRVVLEMAGGKKGLLQNSTNICKGKHLATVKFNGQNGKVAELKPPLRAKCTKKRKGAKRHQRRATARTAR